MNKKDKEKDKTSVKEEQTGSFITEKFEKLKIIINEHKKLSIIIGVSLLLILILGIIIIPKVHQNIRGKEVESMVMSSYTDKKKIVFIPDGELQNTIKKEKDLSVALVDPNDRYYSSFEKVLSSKSKMKDYDGKLYFYPIVYNKKEIEKKYKLHSGLTLIYYENKKEVNRITLDSQKEIEMYLIEHLNSLPMSHSTDVPLEPEAPMTSTGEEGENLEGQEEEIDELSTQESVDQIDGEQFE